jgi:tetratricopeptide (TPR) repeat protein
MRPRPRKLGVTAAALCLAVIAAGCDGHRCARARRAGDPRRIAESCQAAFEKTGDPGAGLAALRARAAMKSRGEAEALAGKLAGTRVEAQALVSLAELYEQTRDPEATRRLSELAARLEAGGHRAEAATVARLLGRVAWAKSHYQDALVAFDRALRLARQAGDVALQRNALLGMFTMLYELGDLRGATAALAEATRQGGPVDAQTRMTIDLDRGLLADAENRPATARAAFAAILRSPALKPGSEMAWSIALNVLDLSVQARDVAAASAARTEVEKLFVGGEFHNRPSSRIARGLRLAQLELLRGQPQPALDGLSALAAEKPSPQWSWQLALERGRALAALHRTDEAIAAYLESADVVESLRGNQALDFKSWALAERRAPFVELFELHAARGDAVNALDVLERTQGRTFLDAFTAKDLPGAAAVSRVEWLQRLYPALRASPLAQAPLPFSRLRESVGGLRALAYFEGKDRLYVVTVDRGTPRVVPGPRLADLDGLVSRFLAAPGDDGAAAALGEALVPAGLAPGLLYVAPSTRLGRVPFGALAPRGRRLVQDQVIAQVPSLNALAALGQAPAAADEPPLVLANASLDLPEAVAEAQAVAGRLTDARLYVGATATTERLKEARGARVLHLAVHSGVGATGPWLGLNDRQVLAGEILDWRISANLVVLASCASSATPDPGLWGSLVASFLAAGSPAVVASLWSTQDRVSRELVERFYAEGGARDPALALSRAQRAWIKEGRPVGDWAAFAFYGRGNNVSSSRLRGHDH